MNKKKSKILVVDDSKSVADFFEEILEQNYYVKKAMSGEDALEIYKTFKPDIILLDVILGGIDGYTVCRSIRSDEQSGFVKIIMVSSQTDLSERLKGYQAGADDYLSKPFEKEELIEKVKVFQRLKTVEDQLNEINSTLNERVQICSMQLIDSEKLAEIGKHTAGIVHNLNNPLQVVLGASELLEKEYPENKQIKSLRKAAGLMQNIVATILSTGKNSLEIENVDLNQVIENQLLLFEADGFFKHEVDSEVVLNPLPRYQGVMSHFSQIFGNIIKNAIDAMYDTKVKTLKISTSYTDSAINIEIKDTGIGIPRENSDKIFNPFFTTKPHAAADSQPTGTGLGLASCKEMIEAYKGKLLVDSEEGKGTAVTVVLPYQTTS